MLGNHFQGGDKMNGEIYLDNGATTKPYDEVVDEMIEMLNTYYGNPSSLHTKGIEAENAINHTRKVIAGALEVRIDEIFFTSGGTEANNIAVQGCALANRKKGNHIIVSSIEHPSILNTYKHLEQDGYSVSYIDVDDKGIIDLNHFEREVRKETILVSIMHVNNEVGSIQPIASVKKVLQAKGCDAIYHVDAIQSFGKVYLNPKQIGIDVLTLSAHKLHGPKGVGAIYVKKGTHIRPIIFGGSQELDIRSGTENVAGIVGFGKAVEITFRNFEQNICKMRSLRDMLKKGIIQEIEDIIIHSAHDEESAPHILNISFVGIKAEVLLHALEANNIFVSTGSACSSNKPSPSHVLKAMKVSKVCIEGAIRFSVSTFNTPAEITYCIEQVAANVKQLRKYMRR